MFTSLERDQTGLFEGELSRSNISYEARFQQYSDIASKVLIPSEEINESTYEALGKPYILFVGNPRLNLNSFTLRPRDYQSIGNLHIPGRSSLFDFLGTSKLGKPIEELTASPKMIQIVKKNTLNQDSTRSDHLWVANLEDIQNAGFKVYYAPVSTNKLHLRIVWAKHAELEYPYMEEVPAIPEEDTYKLIGAFRKIAKFKDPNEIDTEE